MGELSRYKIVLDGHVLPDADREQVVRALCELFHSRPSRMEKLLGGEEVSLKKEYGRAEAVDICHAIREAGARCKLVPVDDQDIEFLDDDSALSELSQNQVGHSIDCPSCGNACDANWGRCPKCNFRLDDIDESEDSITVEAEPVAPTEETATVASQHETAGSETRSGRRDAMREFVGPNADYYLKQFNGMGTLGRPRFRARWHWPALLVFPFWALYRKLWLWAGLYYASSFLVVSLGNSTILLLAFTLVWPLVANYLYFRHVASKIRVLEGMREGSARDNALKRHGGVSKLAMWLGVGASFMMSLYVMGNIKTSLLEVSAERFGLDSNTSTITYGDGSPLLDPGDVNSPLGTTANRFTTMSTALKIVIAAGSGEALDRAIEGLQQKAADQDLRDGWGNTITIDRNDGVITLRSLGADSQADTPDDLVQTIPYTHQSNQLTN